MQQKKNGKVGRKAYLKDFRKTAGGAYRYYGKLYALHGVKEKSFMAESGVFSCGALALTVVSGLLSGPGMDRTPYVLLPYVLTVGAAGSVVWAFCRLLFADRPVRAYVYQGAVQSMPRRCVFTVVAVFLRAAGQTAFLLIHPPQGEILSAVLDYALGAAVVAAVLVLRRLYVRADWREIPQSGDITE